MTLNPAASALTTLFARRPRTMGVFWPAGWPTVTGGLDALRTMIDAGAQYVEVGTHPTTRPAGRSALADAIATVSQIAKPAGVPVAVRAPWEALARIGPVGAATALAKAGAGAVVVPDLPERHVGLWANAARWSGLLTPRVAFRRVGDDRLATVCRAATGWVFTPATDRTTGFAGGPDLTSLRPFVPRIRAATPLPIVIGVGRCPVARAVQVSRFADAVLVGSALIERVQATPGHDGHAHAAAYVTQLAAALKAEDVALTAALGRRGGIR